VPLSWNEIKARAAAFVNDWKDKAPSMREEVSVALPAYFPAKVYPHQVKL